MNGALRAIIGAILFLLIVAGIGIGFDKFIRSPPASLIPVPGPGLFSSKLREIFPRLEALPSEAITIEIKDDWNGMFEVAPIGAQFKVKRDGDFFTGTARFTGRPNLDSGPVAIKIPRATVEEAIKIWIDAPANDGKYEPDLSGVDNYPDMSIAVLGRNNNLYFFSQSQGAYHAPWAASNTGASGRLVVNSPLPEQGLLKLNPYLARDAQKNLVGSGLWIWWEAWGLPPSTTHK